MSGPLEGLKIIEIAGIGPGPFTAMMLADMGADVVRIDRAQNVSGGDPATPPANVSDRGRRSVGVDLKHPDGVEAVLSLCEQADGLIEGFRPGVMERLGLGPDAVLARNPKLVYGRMTGWGQDGPYAAHGRSRHQLHRAGRRARADRSRRRAPGAPAQPGRRLRRRRHAAGLRHGLRPPERAAHRRGPGRRRRHGRRGRHPHDDVPRHDGDGGVERGPRHEPARHGRPLLRRLRDGRRQVRVDRIDRAAVLRRAPAPHRPRGRGAAVAARPGPVARAQGAARGGLQGQDARRVVRDHGGHRRVLRAGPVAERGAASTRTTCTAAPSSSSTASCSRRPRPRFSGTPEGVQRPPAHAGQHTDEVLTEWGIEADRVAKLREAGAIA